MTTPELLALLKKNPILVVCAALSLGFGAALYFRSDLIDEANRDLDEKSALARRYALNISNSVQLKEQYDAMAAANKAIQARTIRPSDIGINQQYFYKLESETGVKLTEINQSQSSRSAPPAKGTYVPVMFSISARGDFGQVMTFLRAVERGTHICRVLDASCTGARTGQVSLSMTIELLGRP